MTNSYWNQQDRQQETQRIQSKMLSTIVEYEQEPQKFVQFCEEVTVVHIQRKSHEENEALFWQPEDYQRMRGEDQIQSTRRARSRVREMKRRMAERSRSGRTAVIGDDQDGQSCSRAVCEHTDSMRLPLDQVESQRRLVAIAAWTEAQRLSCTYPNEWWQWVRAKLGVILSDLLVCHRTLWARRAYNLAPLLQTLFGVGEVKHPPWPKSVQANNYPM